MDPFSLDSMLLVAPALPFARIDAALQGLGWRRDEQAPATPPLLPGEPELAGWTWDQGFPRIVYTFNPAAGLRVLDVGLLPPDARGALAEALPLLDPDAVRALLNAKAPRDLLRGVLAARLLERVELLPAVAALAVHPDPTVAAAAAETREALQRVELARMQAHLGLASMLAGLRPQLEALPGRADIIAAMRPTHEDIDALFVPEFSTEVLAAYDALWEERAPQVRADPERSVLTAWGAPAGLLRTDNELSRLFPRGFRYVAGWLRPERVWVCWRYSRPGESRGTLFDGLAWTGSRWVFCPTPYRVVGGILGGR